MTTHEFARLLLAGPDIEADVRVPVEVLRVGVCDKCKGPRPRAFGRRLCFYCQHPKRRTGKRPDPYSRPPAVER